MIGDVRYWHKADIELTIAEREPAASVAAASIGKTVR